MDKKLLAEAIPSLESALDACGAWKPKPLSEIYKSNCLTPQELAGLYGSGQLCRVDGATPLIEKQAENDDSPLTEEAETWLKMAEGKRPWIVLQCSKPEEADTLCFRVLKRTHSCKAALCRPGKLLEDCNAAPKYGPGNKGSIIKRWCRYQILGISSIGPEMPASAVFYVANLLEERLQQMRVTVIAEDAPSRDWRQLLIEHGATRQDVERMFRAIYRGISTPM